MIEELNERPQSNFGRRRWPKLALGAVALVALSAGTGWGAAHLAAQNAGSPDVAKVRAALKLQALWFLRPGELRTLEWADVDLSQLQVTLPAERMKMRESLAVPLANQALTILQELKPLTMGSRYIFPSATSEARPMSNNAVLSALRRMGIDKADMSGHGFRSSARTILDEVLGERVDLIEHQLAHKVRDVNGRAYNRTTHLPERRKMMQRWADYLDTLRTGGNVIAGKFGRVA